MIGLQPDKFGYIFCKREKKICQRAVRHDGHDLLRGIPTDVVVLLDIATTDLEQSSEEQVFLRQHLSHDVRGLRADRMLECSLFAPRQLFSKRQMNVAR